MAQYTIQKGDTLTAIAKKYNTTVDALAKANSISNPNLIYAGSKLNIPGSSNSTTTSTTSTTPTTTVTNKATNNTSAQVSVPSSATLNSKYNQSQKVTDAYSQYQNQLSLKPGEYQSSYQDQIDQILASIQNNSTFSYDVNADVLYQQYKEQYTKNGQMAMKDTMANAATLSGGYGNSYATTAGQQVYGQYMSELANVIPELEQNAYNKYANEQNERYNQLGALQGLESQAYSEYAGNYDIYNSDLNNAYNNYNTLYSSEYNEFLNALSQANTDREYQLALDQYNTSKSNSDREYQLALDQYNTSKANSDRDYQLSLRQYEDSLAKSKSSKSTGYEDVLETAKVSLDNDYSDTEIVEYLASAVDRGVISEDEMDYIYYIVLGLKTPTESLIGASTAPISGAGIIDNEYLKNLENKYSIPSFSNMFRNKAGR